MDFTFKNRAILFYTILNRAIKYLAKLCFTAPNATDHYFKKLYAAKQYSSLHNFTKHYLTFKDCTTPNRT